MNAELIQQHERDHHQDLAEHIRRGDDGWQYQQDDKHVFSVLFQKSRCHNSNFCEKINENGQLKNQAYRKSNRNNSAYVWTEWNGIINSFTYLVGSQKVDGKRYNQIIGKKI